MNRFLPLILLGVFLNSAAQIVLKQGMRNIGPFEFSLENVFTVGIKVALNPFVLTAVLCYAVSIVVWIMVLSRVDVSFAYPLLSVGYIVTAVAGKMLFAEALGPARLAGILVICVGVYLITQSA